MYADFDDENIMMVLYADFVIINAPIYMTSLPSIDGEKFDGDFVNTLIYDEQAYQAWVMIIVILILSTSINTRSLLGDFVNTAIPYMMNTAIIDVMKKFTEHGCLHQSIQLLCRPHGETWFFIF